MILSWSNESVTRIRRGIDSFMCAPWSVTDGWIRCVSHERFASTSLFGHAMTNDKSASHKVDFLLASQRNCKRTIMMNKRSILALAGATVLASTSPCNALSLKAAPLGISIPFATRRLQLQLVDQHSSIMTSTPAAPAPMPHASADSGSSRDPIPSTDSLTEFNELCRKSIEEARSQLYYRYAEETTTSTSTTFTSRTD